MEIAYDDKNLLELLLIRGTCRFTHFSSVFLFLSKQNDAFHQSIFGFPKPKLAKKFLAKAKN